MGDQATHILAFGFGFVIGAMVMTLVAVCLIIGKFNRSGVKRNPD